MFKRLLQDIIFILSKFNVYLRYKNKNSFKYAYKWILFGKDISNFVYEIENTSEIIKTCNLITDIDKNILTDVLNEINPQDQDFKKFFSDEYFKKHGTKNIFGRRMAWYILARTVKPNLVIESGVDKGLGSGLLCYAQFKNNLELNKNFKYIGIDIVKKNESYFNFHNDTFNNFEFFFENSINFLEKFNLEDKILYISDAEHNYDFEIKEYNLITKYFKKGSLIISDNNSGSLKDFSKKHNKKLIQFEEKSKNFWYKGAITNISYFY